jgi:hypothetical protein
MEVPLKRVIALSLLATLALGAGAQEESAAEQLLSRSIAHHDPEGVWGSSVLRLATQWTNPDGSPDGGESWVVIDNINGRLTRYVTRGDGAEVRTTVHGKQCAAHVNGRPATKEQEETYSLECDFLMSVRDRNLYLYGLPMKLRDPGTIVHPTTSRTTLMGRDVIAMDVSYEPEVGSDTWQFYFSPESAALVGFRFWRGGDGELVVMEDELTVGTLRIPKTRHWYWFPEGADEEPVLGATKTLRAARR